MRPEYPFEAPDYGEIISIAESIDWLRLTLPMALDHLNVYILYDTDGATIVDCGLRTEKLIAFWQDVLSRLKVPVRRILVTHYHPDHIGMAGWLVRETGAELITSRMSYLLARMLQLDVQERPTAAHETYWRRAGYVGEWIEHRMNNRPFNFLDTTEALPLGVRTLQRGDTITLAAREWVVDFGQGHAPDHLTLWNDELVLIGDHCLPAITPVISVFPTEPDADPLHEFMQASIHLAGRADDAQLFLSGHNRPFYGGRSRLLALANHHEKALDRIREALQTPKTMIDCYPLLFRRKIDASVEGFAISEATAHFNYLAKRGEVAPFEDKDGVIRWQLTSELT